MSKNQAASTVNWRKILKKYLADSTAAAVSRGGVDPGTVALPLLRAAVSGNSPLIAALPELNLVDRVVAEIEALNRELEIDLKMLVIPESGRGKLLFPGGESRRARALNSALNGRFDLVIGSIHALLAPAPQPVETRQEGPSDGGGSHHRSPREGDVLDRLGYLAKTKGYLLGWVLIAWGVLDQVTLLLMGLGVLKFMIW